MSLYSARPHALTPGQSATDRRRRILWDRFMIRRMLCIGLMLSARLAAVAGRLARQEPAVDNPALAANAHLGGKTVLGRRAPLPPLAHPAERLHRALPAVGRPKPAIRLGHVRRVPRRTRADQARPPPAAHERQGGRRAARAGTQPGVDGFALPVSPRQGGLRGLQRRVSQHAVRHGRARPVAPPSSSTTSTASRRSTSSATAWATS